MCVCVCVFSRAFPPSGMPYPERKRYPSLMSIILSIAIANNDVEDQWLFNSFTWDRYKSFRLLAKEVGWLSTLVGLLIVYTVN